MDDPKDWKEAKALVFHLIEQSEKEREKLRETEKEFDNRLREVEAVCQNCQVPTFVLEIQAMKDFQRKVEEKELINEKFGESKSKVKTYLWELTKLALAGLIGFGCSYLVWVLTH